MVSSPVERTSGSMYEKVPFGSVVKKLVVSSIGISPLESTRLIPKSLNLETRLSSSSIFAGFKSPCTMLPGWLEWRKIRTEHNSVAIRILICHWSGGELSLQLSRSSRLPPGRYS
uniref:Uncharacterized protein n=1 Tax=Opuntia streptacantha TaxID=393608 RepID=A0A7C9CR79_OPUST